MKLILCGCNGRMGRVITELCSSQDDLTIVAGVDAVPEKRASYPVYADVREFSGEADCLVDFSNPAALDAILSYCLEHRTPAVLATTGYSESQLAIIAEASRSIPLFRSANMSLGVNVLQALVKTAVKLLGDGYDIEIVEKHHNQKLDAPSGTAIMLADAAAEARSVQSEYVYERQSVRKKRETQQIGISSVRGGTIVGVHEVLFAGHDEVLELTHTAQSRGIFASGALKAARFLVGCKPGLYSMADLVNEMLK